MPLNTGIWFMPNNNNLLVGASGGVSRKLLLFGDIAPDVVALSKIYDPDIDGLDPKAVGKYIPAPKSWVVDDSLADESIYSVWVVDYVDDRGKSHLVRPNWVQTDDDAPNRIVGYGNDTYMMYYDKRDDEIRIRLDRKLVFYGTRTAYYKIVRKNGSTGLEEIVTRREDANDHTVGTVIPIRPVDPDKRDIHKIFTTVKHWNMFSKDARNIGVNDWQFSITFQLKGPENTEGYFTSGSAIWMHPVSNGPCGVYYDKNTNEIVLYALDLNGNPTYFTRTAVPYFDKDTTVIFKKIGNSIEARLNGVVVGTIESASNIPFWKDEYEAPFTEGNLTISSVQLTDQTVAGITIFEAPYSDLWVSMGLSSPMVLMGDDCIAVDDMEFTDGEVLTLIVFEEYLDSVGDAIRVETIRIQVNARSALTIEQMDVSSVPIVEFDVDFGNSAPSNTEWVIRRGVSPSTLSFLPKLIFEDGTVQHVPIDNLCCFVYGLEEVNTNHVGMEFNLLFKFWPAKNRPEWELLKNQTSNGFLKCEKTLKVVPAGDANLAKLSPIPRWNAASQSYTLAFYPYYKDHLPSTVIPDGQVTYAMNSFDGTGLKFGTNQNFVVQMPVLNSAGVTETFTQEIVMQVNSYPGYQAREPWLISETLNAAVDRVYGSNSNPFHRPVIGYLSEQRQYHIDQTVFETVDEFLQNFYYSAEPPKYNTDQGSSAVAIAPKPTHFVLRSLDTGNPITAILRISHMNSDQQTGLTVEEPDFQQPFNVEYTTSADEWLNKTVLMEFLQENSGVYSVLYGVPVEVR